MSAPRLHVIMACHNRCKLTVRAASAAARAAGNAGSALTITVYDDGSTDKTANALRELGLGIDIVHGDGSAYWARSMSAAEARVLARTDVSDDDLLVWLNDDVLLDEDAFQNVVETHNAHPGAVIVGAMRDPTTGFTTYSGLKRAGIHPLRFAIVTPTHEPEPVETFNGNLVAVPVRVARVLGGIDGKFSHALADIDYGLRCGRLHVPVLLQGGTHGACPRNPIPPVSSIWQEWKRFTGVKGGGHFSSLRRIMRKSNPRTWWVWIGATYVRWWLNAPVRSIKGRLRRGVA